MITLDDLFCPSGEIYFAERNSDKRTVCISEVPSGVACDCVCVGCRQPMVAYKGCKNRHHFQHAANAKRECANVGETTLHRVAKDYLAQALSLTIPPKVLREGSIEEVITREVAYSFDKATLERKLGGIVPDVLVWKKDVALVVEFLVTHKCDEEKVLKIKTLGLSAIEIDLSPYRKHSVDELAHVILHEAERDWLHHRFEVDAQARLDDLVRAEATARQTKADDLRLLYKHRPADDESRGGQFENWARTNGLKEAVQFDMDGTGCFLVSPGEWQSSILHELANTRRVLSTDDLMAALRRIGYIAPHFDRLPKEIAELIKSKGTRFAAPDQAVETYLTRLTRLGFVETLPNFRWASAPLLAETTKAADELRQRPARRWTEIDHAVRECLRECLHGEAENFHLPTWSATQLPDRPYSVAKALQEFEEPAWISLLSEIKKIPDALNWWPESASLLALPLEQRRQYEVERIRLSKEAEKLKIQRDKENASAERVSAIRQEAIAELGQSDAERWLSERNNRLSDRTPLEASLQSSDLHWKAMDVLNDFAILSHRQAKISAKLFEAALQAFGGDETRATLWINSSGHPALNRRAPKEFCVDEKTLAICLASLSKKR